MERSPSCRGKNFVFLVITLNFGFLTQHTYIEVSVEKKKNPNNIDWLEKLFNLRHKINKNSQLLTTTSRCWALESIIEKLD